MQQQRPLLRTVAATHAPGVVAATRASHPVPSKLGGRRDLRLWRSRGDLRVSRHVSRVCPWNSVGRLVTSGAGSARTRAPAGALSMRIRLAAALLLLALVVPASADAHAFLVSSTPASGVSLARAPRVVTLRFTEPVSPALTRVQIFDGRGTPRAGARVSAGRTANELRVSLPPLATGAYRIAYSTVSQDDLHATRGAIVFGAGTVAPACQGLGFADGRNEHHGERRASVRPDVALAPDRHLRAARRRPARGGALPHHALRARRPAGAAAGRRRRAREQVVAGPAVGGAHQYLVGSRNAGTGARDRRRAGRARDAAAKAGARAAGARRGRRGRERPRRVARRRSRSSA